MEGVGPPVDTAGVADRLAEVRDRIDRAGGDWRAITLVAVTKGFGADAVRAGHEAGLRDFGENYAQELLAKAGSASSAAGWHFLGTIQRRKVPAVSAVVRLWQSVARVVEGQEIARHAPGAGVLVQVNTTGEPHRNGCAWAEVPDLVEGLLTVGLDVRGLMCIGPRDHPRPHFRRLARLARDLQLAEASMGMSDDLEVAVQEGSTMVRLGTALFGPRPLRRELRR